MKEVTPGRDRIERESLCLRVNVEAQTGVEKTSDKPERTLTYGGGVPRGGRTRDTRVGVQ